MGLPAEVLTFDGCINAGPDGKQIDLSPYIVVVRISGVIYVNRPSLSKANVNISLVLINLGMLKKSKP